MAEGITGLGADLLNAIRRSMDKTDKPTIITASKDLRDLRINPAGAFSLAKHILEHQKLLEIEDLTDQLKRIEATKQVTLANKSRLNTNQKMDLELPIFSISGTSKKLLGRRYDSLPEQMKLETEVLDANQLTRDDIISARSTTEIYSKNKPDDSFLVTVNVSTNGQIDYLELASGKDPERAIKLYVIQRSKTVGQNDPTTDRDMIPVTNFPGYKDLVFAVNREEMVKFHVPFPPEH